MAPHGRASARGTDPADSGTPSPPAHPLVTVPPPPPRRRALSCLLSLAIVFAGIAVLVVLVRTKPPPPKAPEASGAAPVEVVILKRGPSRVTVPAHGTVTGARRVIVQPEVAGRVTWQHAEVVPGGRVKKDEPLFKVDTRDYHAALAQQQAQVAARKMDLDVEQGRRAVAEYEWESVDSETSGGSSKGRRLALREPHIDAAKASLQAAQSGLAQAHVNLGRTTVTAPFNALVVAENVDVGQLVTQQSQVATLVGTDVFWIQVAVPLEQLAWIRVPSPEGGVGSKAVIWQQIGDARIEHEGRVIRLLGDLDPIGRMARILVEVDDPLRLRVATPSADAGPGAAAALPLLLGAFVNVDIEGVELLDVFELPRRALREGDTVYVARDDKLEILPVSILWRTEKAVFVRGGVAPDERVILSPMRTAVEGMAVRVVEGEAAAR